MKTETEETRKVIIYYIEFIIQIKNIIAIKIVLKVLKIFCQN